MALRGTHGPVSLQPSAEAHPHPHLLSQAAAGAVCCPALWDCLAALALCRPTQLEDRTHFHHKEVKKKKTPKKAKTTKTSKKHS